MQKTQDVAPLFQGLLPLEAIVSGPETASYQVDGLTPRVALFPRSVEEVAAVLARCFEEGLAVTPWGGGTRMGLGNLPSGLDVALVLTHLNRVLEHQPEELTTTVQAGLALDRLNRELGRSGQYLPLDPPLSHQTTVGGTLASGTSGPLRHRHGTARDLTIGIRVVHADGTITRAGGKVVKNVTGYDMAKLYIGSLGTLGVIVEATFKVLPQPQAQSALIALFPSVAAAESAAFDLLDTPLELLFLDLLDGGAINLLPGVPHPHDRRAAALAVAAAGRPKAVARVVETATALCHHQGASRVATLRGAEVTTLRRALADLGKGEKQPPVLETRIGVLPAQVASVVGGLVDLGQRYGAIPGTVAHLAHGILQGTWRPGAYGRVSVEGIVGLVEGLREMVGKLRGYVVVESCAPQVKEHVDVWGYPGDAWRVMQSLKEQYDPRGILNPGRFVGGL